MSGLETQARLIALEYAVEFLAKLLPEHDLATLLDAMRQQSDMFAEQVGTAQGAAALEISVAITELHDRMAGR